MTGRIPGRAVRLVMALIAAFTAAACAASAASAEKIYNDITQPLPGNWISIGNEAYSNSEVGSLVSFAGAARRGPMVTIGMSSWACQERNSETGACKTKGSIKYSMPVRLNVYEVGPGGAVGALVTSLSQTFQMPYRPSTNTKHCTGGRWYDASAASCFNGKAFTIKFTLPSTVLLPNEAIISVQYNTSDHGPEPVGEAPCRSTAAGCYYDSLNIGLIEPGQNNAPIGSNPSPNELYANTTYNEIDCGSSENLGTFGPTGACWEGEQIAIAVSAKGH